MLSNTITSNFPELVVQDVSHAFSKTTSLRLVDVLIRDPSKVFIAHHSMRSHTWFVIMGQPTAACVVLHADDYLALPLSQMLGGGLAAQLRRFLKEDAASAPCCVCLETKAASGTCRRCLANICLACERQLVKLRGEIITIGRLSASIIKCPQCSQVMPVAST